MASDNKSYGQLTHKHYYTVFTLYHYRKSRCEIERTFRELYQWAFYHRLLPELELLFITAESQPNIPHQDYVETAAVNRHISSEVGTAPVF